MRLKTNYLIHNDLCNDNRKRIDLFNGYKLGDIKELRAYNITIEEQWTEGTTVKMYVILESQGIEDVEVNNMCLALENELDSVCHYNVDFFGDCDSITIEGFRHTIYISVDAEGYNCNTKHNTIEPGIYGDTFKNNKSFKKVKSVVRYIEKYL